MVYQLLLSIHVLFAIFWFGGILVINFVVIPTVVTLSTSAQNEFVQSFRRKADAVIVPVAILTILTGVAVGLQLGVWSRLGTAFGETWAAAFVVATLILLWGVFVLSPSAKRLSAMAPGSPEAVAQTKRVKVLAALELLGFLLIFVLMMMMRFGR